MKKIAIISPLARVVIDGKSIRSLEAIYLKRHLELTQNAQVHYVSKKIKETDSYVNIFDLKDLNDYDELYIHNFNTNFFGGTVPKLTNAYMRLLSSYQGKVWYYITDPKLTYKNVAEAVDASTSGATEFDKSDTDLIDPSGNIIVGISLKKRNAVRWESSKRRPIEGVDVFKSFVEKVGKIGSDDEVGEFENVVLTPLEQKGKYKLTNPETNQTLSKVVIKNTPPSVIKNVVFGDTDKKTIVVKETFEGGFSDFSYDEDKAILTINCYKIYTEVDDLIGTEDEPVFAFSNHIGQAFGIEFRSFSKGLLYKGDEPKGSSAEIDFNDLK
jgi:hypothetical protein